MVANGPRRKRRRALPACCRQASPNAPCTCGLPRAAPGPGLHGSASRRRPGIVGAGPLRQDLDHGGSVMRWPLTKTLRDCARGVGREQRQRRAAAAAARAARPAVRRSGVGAFIAAPSGVDGAGQRSRRASRPARRPDGASLRGPASSAPVQRRAPANRRSRFHLGSETPNPPRRTLIADAAGFCAPAAPARRSATTTGFPSAPRSPPASIDHVHRADQPDAALGQDEADAALRVGARRRRRSLPILRDRPLTSAPASGLPR